MKEENIKIIYGKEKIILSAAHNVLHMREKSIRPRETKTGVIAKNLSKKCKTYCIYKTKNEFNDANWDSKCDYKTKLINIIKKERIKAVIDFHGMAAHREQDVCIGINSGKNIIGYENIVDDIVAIFCKYGFSNTTVDKPFSAKHEYCISNYVARKCMIPAFQIEINLKYRSSKYKEYSKYNNLIDAIEEVVNLVNKEIKGEIYE